MEMTYVIGQGVIGSCPRKGDPKSQLYPIFPNIVFPFSI